MADELKIARDEKSKAEQGALEWEVSYYDQKEYINPLTFLLGPHLNKLYGDVTAEVEALLGVVGVIVQSTSHHAPKVSTHVDDATTIYGSKLGEVDAADDTNIIA